LVYIDFYRNKSSSTARKWDKKAVVRKRDFKFSRGSFYNLSIAGSKEKSNRSKALGGKEWLKSSPARRLGALFGNYLSLSHGDD
jgi:hypothetical protein